jgi:peptide/nickel transport system ATP-binding protein
MPPLLEVRNLTTHIRTRRGVVRAVDDVSFTLEAGETLGLVGESGCGKSMTGLSVMGLLPPGGAIVGGSSVKLDGRELVGLPERELRRMRGNDIAMVFQDPMTSLDPTKTIGHQVAESVLLHRGCSRGEAADRAAEVLGLVGLPHPRERLHDYPHQLSGGLRQRVLIATALANEPRVLIADEPTTALDVTIQAQILALLEDLRRRLDMAVILITHDMGVTAGHTDRVNVMYAGRIAESTGTDRLFRAMRHPYTQSLLASVPRLDQDPDRRLPTIPGMPPDLTAPPDGCRFADRCAYATERCRTEEPELTASAGSNGPDESDSPDESQSHRFACWHPTDGPLPPDATVAAPRAATSSLSAVLGEPLLEARDLVREFPIRGNRLPGRGRRVVHALSGVSLRLNAGETFGLVGESGCGKTTLGRILVGLDRPDSGTVTLDGTDLGRLRGRELRRRRRDLQMMFQDPFSSLDPRMRVGSILREPLQIQGIGTPRQQKARVAELLAEVGLPPHGAELYPHEFSGGQRQRIGLARALALTPRLIVADEPVSALDVSVRAQVLNLMNRLQAAHDLTYVVVSHDLAVVRYLADRIGVMYLGRMVEVGTADDIHLRAAHPYTAGLLRAVPVPDPGLERAKRGAAISGELPSPVDPPSGCRFRTRCPLAQDRCAHEEPALRPFGPHHTAACHFPLVPPLRDAPATTLTDTV